MENQAEKRPENKMGVMPVRKLLLSMSIPMMISMLVQALYNVVDSIFVARISENALTAVSLAFPVQAVMIGVGVGTGVGVNSFLSKSLGEKNFQRANMAAANGILLSWISCSVFTAVGLLGSSAYFGAQTNAAEIVKYGGDYLSIVCVLSFGIFNQLMLERLLISTGKTLYSMISQTIGAITNIILDPIMIFGLLGFPRMEVAGAAMATVIGQFMGAAAALFFNIRVNRDIRLSLKTLRLDPETVKRIYSVGLPSIMMGSLGSVMIYGFNRILLSFTSTAAAVFGVYFKLNSFIFMPVFGLNNGMVPIIAYNFGARNRERIMRTIKLAMIFAFGIMTCGTAIFEIFPDKLLAMFNASDEMLLIGVPALRIIGTHFPFAAICIAFLSIFQALGNGRESLFVAGSRQLLFLLPMAWLLSLTGSLKAVWWSFPAAEAATLATGTFFIRRVYREKIKTIPPRPSSE
jgi:putative MATE family efflux protein